jgi:hypothetical protein
MRGLTPTKKALVAKLQRLGKRVDIKAVDGLFDEILNAVGAATLKSASCTLDEDSSLCLEADEEQVATVKVDRAKSALRMICARLSVRCSEWANREVSPYGDTVEFQLPKSKRRAEVAFQNTPEVQRFEIKESVALAAPVKRSPSTRAAV